MNRDLRDLHAADEALVSALTSPADDGSEELLTRAEVAERAGVPAAVLEALEREGFRAPRVTEPEPRYAASDVDTVRAGVTLLEAGVPLGEVLDLARRFDAAIRPVTERAVDLFVRFVRDQAQGTAGSEEEAATRTLDAFRHMLPATGTVVAHRFRQLLLDSARDRLARELEDGDR